MKKSKKKAPSIWLVEERYSDGDWRVCEVFLPTIGSRSRAVENMKIEIHLRGFAVSGYFRVARYVRAKDQK